MVPAKEQGFLTADRYIHMTGKTKYSLKIHIYNLVSLNINKQSIINQITDYERYYNSELISGFLRTKFDYNFKF